MMIAVEMTEQEYIDFEKQIARVHRTLENLGAEVTWNDRFSDPDNPNQERQIDITIRRSDYLTLIECRKRAAPQDVTWVEELYGRRVSLRANAIIGVSASGFTKGAIQKAQSLDVILRDLNTVTVEESRCWGEPSTLWTVVYEFRDFTIWLDHSLGTERRASLTDSQGRPIIWRTLLLEISKRYDLEKLEGQFAKFDGQITGSFAVNGRFSSALSYSCRMRGRKQEFQAPSVSIYSDPVTKGQLKRGLIIFQQVNLR
jgi:hypothetical protein